MRSLSQLPSTVSALNQHTDGISTYQPMWVWKNTKHHWIVYPNIIELIQFSCNWSNRFSLLCVLWLYASYGLPVSLLLDPLMSSRKQIIFLKIDFLSHWLPHRYSNTWITATVSALRFNLFTWTSLWLRTTNLEDSVNRRVTLKCVSMVVSACLWHTLLSLCIHTEPIRKVDGTAPFE